MVRSNSRVPDGDEISPNQTVDYIYPNTLGLYDGTLEPLNP